MSQNKFLHGKTSDSKRELKAYLPFYITNSYTNVYKRKTGIIMTNTMVIMGSVIKEWCGNGFTLSLKFQVFYI